MPLHVVDGATLKCSLGTSPSKLKVVRPGMLIMGKLEANVMDSKPMTNVLPFGKCKCSGCASIKACKPETSGPWKQVVPPVVGSSEASLLQPAVLECGHGGVINIVNPGQQKQSAKQPKKNDVNVKAETEQKLFEVDTGQVKLEASLKGELSSNPAAQQSFNVSNAQASMSQQLNGATLNLNSAGVPEITLANGQNMPLSMPSIAPAPNGVGLQATFQLGELSLANGGMMNTSLVMTGTVNPINMSLMPVTNLTPAQIAMVGQAGLATTTAVGGFVFKDLIGGLLLSPMP